jgi:hypothetical protein
MSSKLGVMSAGRVALCGVLLLSLEATAQDKEKFAQAQQQNKEALKQYTWKSRTELKMKGESKNVTLEQVRYDLDGKLQKTRLTGGAEQQAKETGGRLRGRLKRKIIKKKKAEFAEMMKELGKLVASYAHIPPEKMQPFLKGAMVTPGEGDNAGTLRIQGGDVLREGDAMTIWIKPQTSMMHRVEILTHYKDNAVKSVSEFRSVSGGPTYQARTTLLYPEKEIELTVENYDYEHVGS